MKKLIWIIILVMLCSIVFAQPPVQTNTNLEVGVDVLYPQFEAVKKDNGFNLFVQAFNRSDGIRLDNTSTDCYLYLYNPQGDHTIETKLEFDGEEFNITLDSGNFSVIGTHAFKIYCNTTEHGGFANGVFEVTDDGRLPYEDYIPAAILIMGTAFIFIYISYKIESKVLQFLLFFIALFISILSLALGVDISYNNNVIELAYYIIVFSVIFTLLFSIIMFIKNSIDKNNNNEEEET